MSSGFPVDPYASSRMVNGSIGDQAAGGGGSGAPELTPRQHALNRYWSFYRCSNYEARKVDWNGHSVLGHVEHEIVATQAYVPPGFVEAPASFPIKFRRPSAPYYVAKIVVDRFTGLLFSQRRSPTITVPGDQATQDYLQAVAKAGKLNAAMIAARTFGGAMGSVAIGFQLVNGRPQFEVHDPRWCTPHFDDRFNQTLRSMEKRYMYQDTIRDRESGGWISAWFWYRRVITKDQDIEWPKVPVSEDEPEPDWGSYKCNTVDHKLGVCPVVWITNVRLDDDVDGDPDCHGAFETIEQIDQLMSQAQRGVVANCDPTVVITTDAEMGAVNKGSDNAIKMPAGSNASYMEIGGSGPAAATTLAEKLRDQAFEVVACVPEPTTQGTQMTATEVVTRLGRMLERADVLRDNYGSGMVRLLDIVLHTLKQMQGRRTIVEDGITRIVTSTIKVPPKMVGETAVPHTLGNSEYIELTWPPYFEPTLDDIGKATVAVATALTAGSLDRKTAVSFLKNYLPIADVEQVIAKIEAEKKAEADMAEQQMINDMREVG